MSNEAQYAFEKGKQLLDDDKANEAVSAFTESVRLAPTNAEYRAWLAQAWNACNNRYEAIKEANRAIELNPKCAKAYRQLGYAQLASQDNQKALNNFSLAIEIEPDVWQAYEARGDIYFKLGNYEDALVDFARIYQIDSTYKPNEYSGEGTNFESWYQSIHKHLMGVVWPKLIASDDKFVEYRPIYMEWGKQSKMHATSDSVYETTHFSYGSGYLCLTSKKIILISLAQVSRQFPFYKQGIIGTTLMALSKQIGQLEKSDKSWSIPYKTVAGAQITGEIIKLVTAAMTWEIYEHFTGDLQVIIAGINAGLSGKFAFSPRGSKPHSGIMARDDLIKLLKQLSELKEQGIISESEFEQKKKELLARI